jgi:hypothetical protein
MDTEMIHKNTMCAFYIGNSITQAARTRISSLLGIQIGGGQGGSDRAWEDRVVRVDRRQT